MGNSRRCPSARSCLLALLAAVPVMLDAAQPELTVSAEELKQFPLKQDLPGDPPESGVRYWSHPFKSLDVYGAYVTVVQRKGQQELWRASIRQKRANTQGRLTPHYHTAAPEERVCIVSRGPDITALGNGEIRFNSSMIDDVFSPDDPAQLSPDRGFSRTHMAYVQNVGYVFYCCVTRGYSPGAVPLLPALFVSPDGKAGNWAYLGKMKGEPLKEAEKRVIWCDGGSIHRLDDGRWRAYLNGYGQVAAAVEADRLDGDWAFVRNGGGHIRELLPDFPRSEGAFGAWIHVLRVGAKEWHLWLTDSWPPQAIWHFSSRNGLDWKPYGRQPELTRIAVGGHGIKCMRTYLDPETNEIVGLLSVWAPIHNAAPNWVLHLTRMRTGLQPRLPD